MKKLLIIIFVLSYVGHVCSSSLSYLLHPSSSSMYDNGLHPPPPPPIKLDTYIPFYYPTPTMLNSISRDFLPVSPSSASLGVFGNIPVGNYTGTLELSLPLHTIEYKELKVPIVALYNSMGNKPDNMPGPIGFCWTLQAGGCITKVTNGAPDLGPIETGIGCGGPEENKIALLSEDYRYLSGDDEQWINTLFTNRFHNYVDRYEDVVMNHNVHPDKYIFNFNGHVGHFYEQENETTFKIQSKNGEYFTIIRNTQTVYDEDPDSDVFSYLVMDFEIIDSRGIKYKFGGGDFTEYSMAGLSSFHSNREYARCPTSWLLYSIESPHGYKIEFVYEPYTTVIKTKFTDFVFYEAQNGDGIQQPHTARANNSDKWTRVEGFTIKEIVTPTGKIVFNNIAKEQLYYIDNVNR